MKGFRGQKKQSKNVPLLKDGGKSSRWYIYLKRFSKYRLEANKRNLRN